MSARVVGVPTFPRGFHAHELHVKHAKLLAKLVLETPGGDVREERERHRRARGSHTAVDGVGLRGIPAIGPGWGGGAIRGSRPGDGLFR